MAAGTDHNESILYRAQIVKARPEWQIVVVLPWQIEIRITKISKKPFDLRRQQFRMKDEGGAMNRGEPQRR